MTKFENLFAEHGYSPELMDVAVQALKRGRNGQGEPVNVILEGSDNIIELNQYDRLVIAHLVDNATGIESARTVGFGILGVVLPTIMD